MDPFHERLARIALDAAAGYGFCLAGGYAVQAHGFVERVSKDVDLFTTMAAAADFPAAQAAVAAALRADGIDITVEREGATFARLVVSRIRPHDVRRCPASCHSASRFSIRAIQAGRRPG